MVYEFTGAVSVSFPEVKRPANLRTFMLTGIAVTWNTAPTTSESVELKLIVDTDAVDMDPLVVSRDPSSGSLTNWVHIIQDGPIPLPLDTVARVTYTNTDARTVKVLFLGYWK